MFNIVFFLVRGYSFSLIFMLLNSFLIYALFIVSCWKILTKCGEPGWKILIPFYNAYTVFKIFWGNGWMFLTLLIPVVNLVISIMLAAKISRAFGKGVGFTLGIFFLPIIFIPILGLGSARYLGLNPNPTNPTAQGY